MKYGGCAMPVRTLIDEDWFIFLFILQLLQVLELIPRKYGRKCIPGECSCIEFGKKCTEACVSHDCKNLWIKDADLENTALDEDDFDWEERIFVKLDYLFNNTSYILLSFCFDNNNLIVSTTWLTNYISVF